ncbi:MAG: DUF4293 domain-containing protein [Bacteroidales bacterium]|nr:DUF4293 domain-containing protein [Bacteroidales bacterium]
MIQRIQSLYLLLALTGFILMFGFPIATYTMPNQQNNGEMSASLTLNNKSSQYIDESHQFFSYIGNDVVPMGSRWALTAIVGVLAVMTLASMFLYRKRVLQMRIVASTFMVNVVYLFLIFFWAIEGIGGKGGYLGALVDVMHLNAEQIHVQMWTPGSIVPIVTVVLLLLAQRAIRSDEMKVRAADRLR